MGIVFALKRPTLASNKAYRPNKLFDDHQNGVFMWNFGLRIMAILTIYSVEKLILWTFSKRFWGWLVIIQASFVALKDEFLDASFAR